LEVLGNTLNTRCDIHIPSSTSLHNEYILVDNITAEWTLSILFSTQKADLSGNNKLGYVKSCFRYITYFVSVKLFNDNWLVCSCNDSWKVLDCLLVAAFLPLLHFSHKMFRENHLVFKGYKYEAVTGVLKFDVVSGLFRLVSGHVCGTDSPEILVYRQHSFAAWFCQRQQWYQHWATFEPISVDKPWD